MIAYDRLSQIIPPEIALGNKALSVALGQISGIPNMTLPMLAQSVTAVRTNFGLPAINSQTQPVNTSTKNFLLANVGIGTGVCNSITIEDCMGTVTGWVVAANLNTTTTTLNTMNTTSLAGAYQECLNCMNGVYTTQYLNPLYPPVLPEYLYRVDLPNGGSYVDYTTANAAQSAAISGGSIPYIQSQIAATASAYPTQVVIMNANFGNICQQIGNEQDLQVRAGLNFADSFANLQPNSQSADFSFVFSLPSNGQNIEVGGTAQFLEFIANTTNQGGQAVVAVMRQGQSNAALNEAGILTASDIPLIPNPPPAVATLSTATYTVAQAVANVKY